MYALKDNMPAIMALQDQKGQESAVRQSSGTVRMPGAVVNGWNYFSGETAFLCLRDGR